MTLHHTFLPKSKIKTKINKKKKENKVNFVIYNSNKYNITCSSSE